MLYKMSAFFGLVVFLILGFPIMSHASVQMQGPQQTNIYLPVIVSGSFSGEAQQNTALPPPHQDLPRPESRSSTNASSPHAPIVLTPSLPESGIIQQQAIAPVIINDPPKLAPPAAPPNDVSLHPSEAPFVMSAESAYSLPNLFTYHVVGWDGPVVASNYPGGNTNTDVYEIEPTYIDWAVANEGIDVVDEFTTCIFLDDQWMDCWISTGLPRGYMLYLEDWIMSAGTARGWHRITLGTDVYNMIEESNEDDNWWSVDFYWYPDMPQGDINLGVFTPNNWASPLILANVLGANDNTSLYVGETVYVNWAFLNEGTTNIVDAYTTCLYIDYVEANCWSWFDGLDSGSYLYAYDEILAATVTEGWHYVEIVADVYDDLSETNEYDNRFATYYYWEDPRELANLTPYTPDGWDYPVVPSSDQNSDIGTLLYGDLTTYFDIAFVNDGDIDAPGFMTCLYIDNVETACWSTDLPAGFYYFDENFSEQVGVGWHEIKIVVDVYNDVAESNEGDNVWAARFYWEASSLPNLKPHRPDQWDDAIVPSSISGTNVIDALAGNEVTYIDWSIINSSWRDIEDGDSFSIALYLDGEYLLAWDWSEGLQWGWLLLLEDYQHLIPEGWHTLAVHVDPYNQIPESNEDDNWLELWFYWNAPLTAPEIRIEPTEINIKLEPQSVSAAALPTRSKENASFDPLQYGTGAKIEPVGTILDRKVPLPGRPEVTAANLPSLVDLQNKLPPIGNQGGAGSCVGWAVGYYYKSLQEGVDQRWALNTDAHQFSPNYVWNQLQWGPQCGGVGIGSAFQIIEDIGNITLDLFPYTENCQVQPTLGQIDRAMQYRAENYGAFVEYGESITDARISQMKQWLAAGDAFVVGLEVRPEFDSPFGPHCIVDVPTQGDIRGLHAVTVVGYDDDIGHLGKGGFKIVNSWGSTWACGGYAYLTYDWFREHVFEAWWMRDIRTGGNAERDFTIFNDGEGALIINDIYHQGNAWMQLVLPSALPIHVSPGDSVTIAVNANNAGFDSGIFQEVIVVESNDPDEPATEVSVTLEMVTSSLPPLQSADTPQPENMSVDQVPDEITLRWSASGDPNTTIVYDVRLDTKYPPFKIVCNDRTTNACRVTDLLPDTTYYWRIATSNGLDTTLGPVWEFTTGDHAYTIDLEIAGNGSVTASPMQENYRFGDEVTLIAQPDTGWEFVGWGGDISGNANPYMFNIQGNMSVTATFQRIATYSITANSVGSGSIQIAPEKAAYLPGDTIEVLAIPAAGWEFVGWGGDISGNANPYVFNIQGNMSIAANFQRVATFSLGTTITGNGSIQIAPRKASYSPGDRIELFAIPDTGWEFVGWGGDISGNANPYMFNIQGNMSVTARFSRVSNVFLPLLAH